MMHRYLARFNGCSLFHFLATTLSLLLLEGGVLAQQPTSTVDGRISDAETGEVLAGAMVAVQKANRSTITNGGGWYTLKGLPVGEVVVYFEYIGYEPQTQTITLRAGEIQHLNIKLQPSIQQVQEVLVTSKSRARVMREQAMPIQVITTDQLAGTVSNVSDVLNRTMGITIRSQGGVGSVSRISIRGLEGKRVGFFIDGNPMNEHTDFVSINDVPLEMIDRVEIYKGVVPPKLGGSAMGGAINIVLKEYPPRYLDASYAYESYNTHKGSLVVKRNLGSSGILLGAGGFYTHSDNDYVMDSPIEKGLRIKRNHDRFNGYGGGFSLTANRWYFDKLKLEVEGMGNRKQEQGILYDIRKAERSSNMAIAHVELERNDFLLSGLDLDADLGFSLIYNRLIDTAKYRYTWQGRRMPGLHAKGGELGVTPSNNLLVKQVLVSKINLNYIINPQHALNLNSYHTTFIGDPSDPLRVGALGYPAVFRQTGHNVTLGLSHEWKSTNDRFLNAITGKYYFYGVDTRTSDAISRKERPIHLRKHYWGIGDAMRYRVAPWLIGKLSAAWEVRTPAESEMLGDGFLILPAADLNPERGVNANAGLLFDWDLPSGILSVEVNGFYNHLWDMIRLQQGFVGTSYINHGEMRTLGGEIEVKADATRWLYLYANATYQDLRDTRKYIPKSKVKNYTLGMRMPNIPYFLANGGLELHREDLFGLKNTNWRLFADGAFTEEFFFDFEQSKRQERRIPRQVHFDLGAEIALFNNTLYLSGKLSNITNAKLLSEYNYPLPGRTFSVKVRYVFK